MVNNPKIYLEYKEVSKYKSNFDAAIIQKLFFYSKPPLAENSAKWTKINNKQHVLQKQHNNNNNNS